MIRGHCLGEGILKTLKENGCVEAAVRMALPSLFGQGQWASGHGEKRVLFEEENRDTLEGVFR